MRVAVLYMLSSSKFEKKKNSVLLIATAPMRLWSPGKEVVIAHHGTSTHNLRLDGRIN